jgi:hypothetical protein
VQAAGGPYLEFLSMKLWLRMLSPSISVNTPPAISRQIMDAAAVAATLEVINSGQPPAAPVVTAASAGGCGQCYGADLFPRCCPGQPRLVPYICRASCSPGGHRACGPSPQSRAFPTRRTRRERTAPCTGAGALLSRPRLRLVR